MFSSTVDEDTDTPSGKIFLPFLPSSLLPYSKPHTLLSQCFTLHSMRERATEGQGGHLCSNTRTQALRSTRKYSKMCPSCSGHLLCRGN